MSEEQKTEQTVADTPKKDVAQTGADSTPKPSLSRPAGRGGFAGRGGARRPGGKPGFRKGSRFGSSRPKPEFEQKIINISRVTRVVKGGRRLSFRVDMIIGDKKGRVGLGSGKATDTSLAIQKAFNVARKNLVYLKLTKNNSIPFPVKAKVTSSDVEMMPNKERGLVAGSTMRSVLVIAGITDVTARVHSRSKNKLNNAKAAIEALKAFEMPTEERKVLEAKHAAARAKAAGKGRFGGRRFDNKGGSRFNRRPRPTSATTTNK